MFYDEKGNVFAAGIQADGSYKVDKVPLGSAQIAFYVQPQIDKSIQRMVAPIPKDLKLPGGIAPKQNFSSSTAATMTLPSKYGDPKTSGLTYTVKSGKQEYDIDLK